MTSGEFKSVPIDFDFWNSVVALDYETGVLTIKKSKRSDLIGKRAGTKGKDGYIRLNIGGRRELAHRVIWLLVYKCWPSANIDHINRVTSDNRPVNLRDVTQSENLFNQQLRDANNTGAPGILLMPTGRYEVRQGGKYLGRFESFDLALTVKQRAENDIRGI